MKNVLLLLRENQEAMSHAEATVAKYICANPEECAHLTIRELAERTWSSPSSIVRMWTRSVPVPLAPSLDFSLL